MFTKEELEERVKALRIEKKRLTKEYDDMQKAFSEKLVTLDEFKPLFTAYHKTCVLLREAELELERAWR